MGSVQSDGKGVGIRQFGAEFIGFSIPVTNTSVNPARSTGVALFVGGWTLAQLWLFWLAPIVGGALGAAIDRVVGTQEE